MRQAWKVCILEVRNVMSVFHREDVMSVSSDSGQRILHLCCVRDWPAMGCQCLTRMEPDNKQSAHRRWGNGC
jgi:hypothetical protein